MALHGDRRCSLALGAVRFLPRKRPGLPLHFLLEDLVFLTIRSFEDDVQDEEEQGYDKECTVKNEDAQNRVVRHPAIGQRLLGRRTKGLLFGNLVAVLQTFTLRS